MAWTLLPLAVLVSRPRTTWKLPAEQCLQDADVGLIAVVAQPCQDAAVAHEGGASGEGHVGADADIGRRGQLADDGHVQGQAALVLRHGGVAD